MDRDFLKTLLFVLWPFIGGFWALYCFGCVPMPWKLILAPAAGYPALFLLAKQLERAIRLGFAHDRVREIPEAQMARAMDDIEKERKKSRTL